MDQPTLFDNPPIATATARKSDPVTSALAAEHVETNGTAATQREAVLEYVRQRPGQTSAEIAVGLAMKRQDPARRLPELKKAGLVTKGPARTCAATGMKCLTWEPVR